MKIKNVKIGDKFKNGKHIISEVVDFYEVVSLTTGEKIKNMCIAKNINGIASNLFEVPFSTVVRHKIN